MKIKVEQKHIDNGIREMCGLCPIALAIREVVPDKSIRVRWTWVDVCDKAEDRMVTLPKSATAFIYAFDENKPVAPFEFELAI